MFSQHIVKRSEDLSNRGITENKTNVDEKSKQSFIKNLGHEDEINGINAILEEDAELILYTGKSINNPLYN